MGIRLGIHAVSVAHCACRRDSGGGFGDFCSVVSELLYGVRIAVRLLLYARYLKGALFYQYVCHVSCGMVEMRAGLGSGWIGNLDISGIVFTSFDAAPWVVAV